MATLERIRQRSGLLIAIIGVAMLAFILTDLLGNGQSILRGQQSVVVEINGEAVEIQEFSKLLEERTESYKNESQDFALNNVTTKQLADAVFSQLKAEKIMAAQYEELGFTVTSAELFQRIKSNPQIQQAQVFRDQVSGQFSDAALQRYVSQTADNAGSSPEAAQEYKQWLAFEDGTRQQTLSNKYSIAISKGMYIPEALAKMDYNRNNESKTASYTGLLYSSIADSTVEVSESDIRKYYNEHKELYKTENSRGILYVNFLIEPSTKDKADLSEELRGFMKPRTERNNATGKVDTIPSFANATNDSAFAAMASELPVTQPYYTLEDLPNQLDSSFFTSPVGTVRGPYAAGEYYRLTKITERTTLPDSAKASHILIAYQGAERAPQNVTRAPQEALALADSLLAVVQEDPAQFDVLARTMSDDAVASADGGNVGWMNKNSSMAAPFKNFALYKPNGTVGKVFTQFGIHIMKITDQKGANSAIKVTSISMELSPSEATLNNIYNNAGTFAAAVNGQDNFGEKAEEMGYVARPVKNIKEFDENISGIGANRDIVKWAFNEETNVGDLQVFSNSSNSYVVAVLTDADEEGYGDPMKLKDRIEPEVRKEKKAQQLFAKLDEARKKANDINGIAQNLGTQVQSQSITYSQSSLTGYGNEPKVIGYISGMQANALSGNIKGDRGVYVAMVTQAAPAPEKPSYMDDRTRMESSLQPRANSAVYQSLEKAADIKDNRAVFY
jgi:parvulin-like peptidyl-prolyl isomerase